MKFSILLPTYKDKFLKECIDSILQQNYKDFELIIVNDASPYDISSIVINFSDDRIRYYVNEKNIGSLNLVDNWNKCLGYAKGEYIICMGDDDKLLPNCLDEYAKLIEKYPGIGLLHGWTEIIDENSHPYVMTAMRGLHESAISLSWHRVKGVYNQQFIGDFCFEREWLVKNGGFYNIPLAWGSDDISAVIGASKNGVANTQVPVFQYRANRYSVSSIGNVDIKIQAIQQTKEWFKNFLSERQDNFVDELYREDALKAIDHNFEKKIGLTLARDISQKGYGRMIYWIHKMNKCHISKRSLIYGIIKAKTIN